MTIARCCVLLVISAVGLVHAGMYNDFVTVLTPENFDAEVTKSAETWMVKFYAPWCGHCRSSAGSFSKAAKRLHGVARLGVVDCDAHAQLGSRFGVSGYPSFKIFSGVGKRARRPSDYSGERTASGISSHIRYVQQSFVAKVMPNGEASFFNDLPKLPHVLLFTDKKETSGLYKGLSARYHKRIAFGDVRKKDGASTVEMFDVTSFPTLLVFSPGDRTKEKAVKYTGKMDPTSLIKYMDNVLKDGPDAADAGEEAAEKDEKKVFAQPKAYNGEVESISSKSDYETKCGSRNDGRLCVLGFLPDGVNHDLKVGIAEAAKQYLYDNVAFALIDTKIDGGSKFATELFDTSSFVAVRARKSKFASMNSNGEIPDIGSIKAFVDRVVGGEVRYSKMTDLPEWVGESTNKTETDTSEDAAGDDGGQCTGPPKDGGTCGGDAKEEL